MGRTGIAQAAQSSRSGAGSTTVARIADTRAEILGMITSIGASQHATRERRRSPERADQPGPGVARVKTAARSDARGASLPELAALLHGTASRLASVAERLGPQTLATSAPASARFPRGAMFSGVIHGQMLSDMLQLVSANGLSGVFVIETDTSQCRVYFGEGRIRHADDGASTGVDAFFAAFAARNGRYHFTETVDLPDAQTVTAGTQLLVLEALRRMDERNA